MPRLLRSALLVYVLAVPLYVAWQGHSQAAWIALAAGLAGILFVRFSDLVELSLGPIKAKLAQKVEEAAATVEQLRGLASVLGEITLAVLIAEGRVGGMGYQAKFSYKALLERELHTVGLTAEQIGNARKIWHQYMTFDHGLRIIGLIPNMITIIAPDINSLIGPDLRTAPPAEWRSILSKHRLLKGDVEEAVIDLEHYLSTGNVRRPSLWKIDDMPLYGAEFKAT